jgi:hypothetical protein
VTVGRMCDRRRSYGMRGRRLSYRVNIQTWGGIEIETIRHHVGWIEKFLNVVHTYHVYI